VYRNLELFQELVLMREFEKTENILYEKLQEKSTEKLNMDKMVTDAMMHVCYGLFPMKDSFVICERCSL